MVICYSPDIPRSAFGNCPSGYYGYGSCCSRYTYSAWDSWARWVLVSGLVIFFLMLFALLCCCHSRRRRRRGATPFYGSGWMSNGQKFQMQNQPPNNYPPPPQYSAAAPPPQGQQYTGSTMQPSDGYYGQAAQYQPQQPQNVYYGGANRGTTDYAPPAGPPPGKP